MPSSSDLSAIDRPSLGDVRSTDASDAATLPLSATELAAEVNVRLAALGSRVRAEVDEPPRERTHLILRGPAAQGPDGQPAWEELVRVSSLPNDREAAVADILGAVDSKLWERSPGATLRLARSSIWCDPL